MPPQPSTFVPVAGALYCKSASSLHLDTSKCYRQLKTLHGTQMQLNLCLSVIF